MKKGYAKVFDGHKQILGERAMVKRTKAEFTAEWGQRDADGRKELMRTTIPVDDDGNVIRGKHASRNMG